MEQTGRHKIITTAAGSGAVAGLSVWASIVTGIVGALVAAITLIVFVKNQAQRQDQARYDEGYKDGVNACQPELWAYRARYGIIAQVPRAPSPPQPDGSNGD